MNIYIGNLHLNVAVAQLRNLFSEFGRISMAKIIRDKDSGQSRGYGFVEMDTREDGLNAIKELNNRNLMNRFIEVNEVRK